MDWFLEYHNLPKLIEYSIHNLNNSRTIKEISSVFFKLLKKKPVLLDEFIIELY